MKRVITYGTFDLFHKGHYNILKRARELGDYLIVGVTSESFDIERGKLNVRDSILTRIENVKKTGFADEIIIEEYQGQKVSDIVKYNIDILVVGSDWRGKFDYLKNYCEVRYLERTKNISSTQLRGEGQILRIGVVADTLQDNDIVQETRYVSGLHVEGVFSELEETARQFCEKYELNSWWTDYEEFLSGVEIVYVSSAAPLRLKYIERAIDKEKYVISDPPVTLEPRCLQDLFARAGEHHVVLVEKIMLAYLRAFNQLVWLSHGDLAGDVVAVKCAISREHFGMDKSFEEVLAHAVCAVIKLLGKDYLDVNTNTIQDEKKENVYSVVTISYPGALASIEIGSTVDVEDELVIIGRKGRITVPNDWWNTGYFEAKVEASEFLKRFSFNFEGNGFRYLLQELVIMIQDRRTECTRLFNSESIALVEILKKLDGEVHQ